MKPFRLLPLLIFFLVSTAVRAGALVPPLKPVPFQKYQLPNGLRVVLSPDHSIPVASVCVIYDVGARNETVGHSGFAHLFEHLMFQGSAHVRPEQHHRLIQWAGGYSNGTTYADYTKYYEAFPREQLKLALFLEADRMFSLRLTQDTFAKAREIVKAEKRETHDVNAYDHALVGLQQMAFTKFANSHQSIGTVDDLENATFEDVQRFHATYYTPNNAVLAVAGDFDPAQVKTLIAKYFASQSSPSIALPRVDNAEPLDSPIPPEKRAGELRLTRVALPYYYLAFRIPPESHPDFPALVMLSDILGDGDISRCGKRLVERGIATQEGVRCYGRRGPSLLVFSAQAVKQKANLKEIAAGFAIEISRIRQQLVTDRELARVRNEERLSAVRSRKTVYLRCSSMATNEICFHDPNWINTYPAALQAVTAADVLRVARKYLTSTNGVELFVK